MYNSSHSIDILGKDNTTPIYEYVKCYDLALCPRSLLAKVSAKYLSSEMPIMFMKEKIEICSLAVILFALLIGVGMAEITAPVDIIVLKGDTGVDNASVRVDGQYRGMTVMGGHLYIQNLTQGYHTVNAQYEDTSGKYVGNSGFEIQPGNTTAKVYLERSG